MRCPCVRRCAYAYGLTNNANYGSIAGCLGWAITATDGTQCDPSVLQCPGRRLFF